jgi:SNF2 family DNA or RNA helicase
MGLWANVRVVKLGICLWSLKLDAGVRNVEGADHNGPVLILHACLTEPGYVHVWGEDSAAAREVRPARGRPAKAPRVKRHPYAASLEQLVDAVAGSSTPARSVDVDDQDLVLQLPTGKRGPAPSTGAVEVAAGTQFDDMWLAPWLVPTLRIDLGNAAEDLALGTQPAVSVVLGSSWRWLTKLARFSLEAVAAGRVIPSLVEHLVETGSGTTGHRGHSEDQAPSDDHSRHDRSSGATASQHDPGSLAGSVSSLNWRPVLSPVDLSRLRRLATSMPPSARTGELVPLHALDERDDNGAVPLEDRLEVAFLVLTDALVRQGLQDHVVPPGRSVRSWLLRSLTAPALEYLDVEQVPIRRRALVQLSQWQQSFEHGDESIRICFRLQPPQVQALPANDSGGAVGTRVDSDPEASAGVDQDAGTIGQVGGRVRTRVGSTPGADVDDESGGPAEHLAVGANTDSVAGTDTNADLGTDSWLLEILLQSTDDPSLMVPLSEVWESGGEVADTFGGSETRVLESLGRASRNYPALDEALESAKPSTLDLTTQGAVDFLTVAAVGLEEAGFGVLVPQTLRGTPRARVQPRKGTPTDGQVVPAGFGLDEMIQFDWSLALGDESVDFAELAELAELKAPLVRLRGKWVHVEPDEIASLVAAIERQSNAGGPQATVRELIHAGLGLAELDVDVPVDVGGDDAWLSDLVVASLGLDVSDYHSIPTPAGIDGLLRDYQERGLGWLSFMDRLGLGACLADDMGLGKTIQLLSLLVAERESAGARETTRESSSPGSASLATSPQASTAPVTPPRQTSDPEVAIVTSTTSQAMAPPPPSLSPPETRPAATLLVAPMSLVGNWQKEAARFAPGLSVYVHHGVGRAIDDFVDHVAGFDMVLTTYAIAARDRDTLAGVRWGRIVLDEAQNIKNARTKASVALRGLEAGTRIALTGTPVENRLSELWSILDFCNPGLLGPAKTFHDRFAIPIERYQDAEATRLLSEVSGPFILRRTKTDPEIAAGLPDKTEIKAYCTLTKEQASLYQATVDDLLTKVEESEGIARRGLVLAMMLRLKQVCNHPAQLLADNSEVPGRSGKVSYVEETLTEVLAVGEKALIFTQFVEMGQMLTSHLSRSFGVEVLFLHGGVSRTARDAMVQSFNSDNGPPIFVLSLKAGGTGLNLTAANHVIHFDRWWNPAVEDQASDRAFRIGQTRNVQVRKLICGGTLEDRIDEMIDRKKALAGSVVSSGESWLTELSTAELADVIALGRDAVMED